MVVALHDRRAELEGEIGEKGWDIKALHRRLDEAEKDVESLKNLQKSIDIINNKEVEKLRGKIEGLESAIKIIGG